MNPNDLLDHMLAAQVQAVAEETKPRQLNEEAKLLVQEEILSEVQEELLLYLLP